MKKVLILLSLLLPTIAFAQSNTQRNPCFLNGTTTNNGIANCTSVSSTNPLPVTSGSGTSSTSVQGTSASGSTAVGNPVGVGGIYLTTPPTLTDGQRGDLRLDANENLNTKAVLNSATAADTQSNTIGFFQSQNSGTNTFLLGGTASFRFNGTQWERTFACTNSAVVSVTAGATTQIVALSGATNIRVCSIALSISTAGTAQFVSGTGTNCATGTANLTGAISMATATPFNLSAGDSSLFRAGASNALCLAAVTGNVTGFISYAQF